MQARRNVYYPHVDGIRAIAVLSVLFYHVGWAAFAGGFVGVDVFFVISGYLITSHVLEELRAGRFRLRDFYIRRVRRLGPALLFTLIASFVVGAMLFPPAVMERLSDSTTAATLSVSNIFFWTESGYFDSDAGLKPLLHTWSLGVEEQFYLVWPVLLLLAARARVVVPLIVVLGIVSLLFSEWVLARDPSAAFFLTPFRMTEFGIGALLATASARLGTGPTSSFPRELSSLAGILLIGYAVFTYSHDTQFPGVTALVPCFGAAALLFGGGSHWSAKVLANPILVAIGLISYSLYLAHWPVIVFYRYWTHAPLDKLDQIMVLALSGLIGFLMHRYVEMPFRRPSSDRSHIGRKRLGLTLGSAASALLLASVHAATHDGWTWRGYGTFALTAQEISEQSDRRFRLLRRICESRGWDHCAEPLGTEKTVLILGDSHGPDGLNILATAFPDENFAVSVLSGCPPLVEKDLSLLAPNHPDRRACVALNEQRFNPAYLERFDTVVISVLFDWYRPEHLAHTIAALKANGVRRILLFGNYLVLREDLADLFARGIDPSREVEWIESLALYEEGLEALAEKEGATLVSKASYLCDDVSDATTCVTRVGDDLAIYDRHHLSVQAAQLVGRRLTITYPSLDAMLEP